MITTPDEMNRRGNAGTPLMPELAAIADQLEPLHP
jgi:hypothetical protein